MNIKKSLLVLPLLLSQLAFAEEFEIEVPNGWSATAEGIAKGKSELAIGPILEFGELSASEYLAQLAKIPTKESEIVEIGELKDGEQVLQITRELKLNGSKARSTLFVCKSGRNENRLIELYTESVLDVISGGKAAIGFCSQS